MTQPDSIEQFLAKFTTSLGNGSFVRLALSRPVQSQNGVKNILARLVDLKGQAHLSLTFRKAMCDVTKNIPIAEAAGWAADQIRNRFQSALLCTTTRDWQLSRSKNQTARLIAHRPSSTNVPDRAHDRTRQQMLDPSAQDWLHGLGVTDEQGKVRVSMSDKYRQTNRYLEILSHLAHDCGWDGNLPITLADMGCGKGYLTFGAWHWFRRVQKQPVRIIGIESRADLVKQTNQLAQRIGATELNFVAGAIESVELLRLDGLIALHACDTATDQAILRGVELGARLIVVAPCCHKEVRPKLQHPEPFAPVLRHGLMEERLAEWVTDGLRALFLEWAGYRTKVFEFISTEHTAKNLMISAVRQDEPFASPTARRRIEELKDFFGVQRHTLDSLLER